MTTPKGVYVTALEPGSGKSAVVLGLAELLSRRAGRLAFLRPRVTTVPDPDTELIRERYRLPPARVAALLAPDGPSDAGPGTVLGTILEAYRAVAVDADVVLVEGSDFAGLSLPTELDLNVDAAIHLGCPVLLVVGGRNRSAPQVLDAVRQDMAALAARGCALLGVVANRVDPRAIAQVRAGLATVGAGVVLPTAALPEIPLLAAPTVAQVAAALGAQVLREGNADRREVSRLIVGAMGLTRFLERLSDGDLVITPADRADIIAGCLAAHLSGAHPAVAGLLLTGGSPDEPVRRLVEGLAQGPGAGVPVIAVDADTYPTATAAAAVRGAITAASEGKIATVLRLFDEHTDGDALLAGIEVDRPRRTTPLMFEHALVERARAARRHIVLPEGEDDRILLAAEQLLARGVAELTVLGDPATVHGRATALGLDLADLRVLEPETAPERAQFARAYAELRRHKGVSEEAAADLMCDPSYFGTMMVHLGLADGMVSGAAHTTAHTIRPAFEFIRTAPGVSIVSGAFLMCLADRVLVYADCAVVPEPDAGQLADIAISSAGTATMFGIEPRIAMLSYSTGESGSGAGVDEVRRATALVRERRPDLAVEGPLQYDAAVDPGVAAAKLPGNPVAGRATVCVFPDLNTGNNTYKAVQRSAGAVAIGPVLQGLAKPVNDLSRGATVTDIVNTVAITVVQAASPLVDPVSPAALGRPPHARSGSRGDTE